MNPPPHDPIAGNGVTPAGLQLDARRRAMLAEMKIPMWWPQAAAESEPQAVHAADGPHASVSTPVAAPASAPAVPVASAPPARPRVAAHDAAPAAFAPSTASAPVADGAVEHLDWAQLRDTIQACSACGLCAGRKAPVFVADPLPSQADWLIVGEPPDEHEERAGAPFVGSTGQLLDNMLQAVQLRRDGQGRGGARLTPVVKCRPAAVRNPTPQELAQCAVYLEREIALTRPRVIVAMGRFAALSLLGRDHPELLKLPFGQVRGKVYRRDGIAVVVTYHPSKLLRAPPQKAQAWADLCLARAQALSPSSPTP